MKFVLIGQSPAVVSAIKTIRGKDASAEITLVSCDGHLPYDRSILPHLITRKTKEKDLFIEGEEFYKANNVTVFLDKEVTRINFSRRKVFLADKQNLDYDALIMTDAPQVRLLSLKGIRRTGVLHAARLDGMKGILRHMPYIETAVVELSTPRGLSLALALKDQGKDVVALIPQESLLPGLLDGASAQTALSLMEKKGIRIVANNAVEDILGETEVKAVRLKTGKVVACEAIIFDNVPPDLRFLEGGELVLAERIPVAGSMQTSAEHVYALDTLAQLESPKIIGDQALSRQDIEWQGEIAAAASFGEQAVYDRPLPDSRSILEAVFSISELSEVFSEAAAAPATESAVASVATPVSGLDPAGHSGG